MSYLEKEMTPGLSVVLLNASETLLPNSAIPSRHCVDWSMRQISHHTSFQLMLLVSIFLGFGGEALVDMVETKTADRFPP